MSLKNFSHNFWKVFSIFAVVGVLFVVKPNPTVQASNLRFPDLRTLPPRDLRFDRTDVDAESVVDLRNVLRFSNTVYNAGEGKLEMWGSINPATKNGIAYQRVYDTDGTYTDYQVGIFYYHIPHDHYHFEDWGQYELWTRAEYENFLTTGGSSADYTHLGTKTTACVLDEEFITTLIETPFPGVYPWTGCMPNAENLMVEGISVGWGDTYDYYRFEQWIDLGQGTLADGDYVLRSISDPLNKMYESPGRADAIRESITDNEAATYFTISGGEIMDSNPPSGTVFINDVDATTLSPGVTVNVIGRDDVSGVDQVMLSNDGISWATFDYTGIQSVHQAISWNLADPAYGGNGQGGEKTVYAKFKDNAGNFSGIETDTIIFGAFPPTSNYSSAVISDSPISYWRLAEPSGTTAIDNQGMNHGVYTNDPALGFTGLLASEPSNTAVKTDGVNDFIKVNNSNSLNLTTAITLEAWIQPDSIPATGTFNSIITKPESFSLQFNGPKLEFTIIQNGVKQRLQTPANALLVVGQKYHIAGTYDGSVQKLYINGVLVNSQALTGAITTNAENLYIANWNDSETENFNGTIDEIAIYGSALPETRVITHYDTGMGIDTEGPDTQFDSYPEILINTTGAAFTFSSPLATATFECSLDEAAFTACTSPKNLTSLSNGSHSFRVRAKSPEGLVDQTPASYIWTIDTVAPAALSIVRQYPSPTNIDTLAFNVTFNEAVTDVDANDFAINGSTTATISNVTLTTTSLYKVTISGGDLENFNGSVGLNFNAATINDLASNAFAGAEPATDEVYVLDNAAPNVSSITRVNANPTSSASVNFTVTFTEAVTGVDASDFSLTVSGVTGTSITNVTGTGTTRTVTVNTGSGNGTIRLDKVFNATIADLTGNSINGVPFTSGESYTVEKNHAPTNITLSNSSINENQAVGTTIGNLTTSDVDAGDTFTYSFCGGTDDASFQINGSQLRNGAVFNYETKSSYSVCIRSTDSTSQFFDKTFSITVANVNEEPVITEGTSVNVNMSEDSTPTPFSLTLNAADPENNTLTWSISTPAGHGTASASGTGTTKSIGYIPNSNYAGSDTFVVRVSDGTLTDTITVNVTIGAVNNAPTDITLSNSNINENLGTGIVIGNFSTADIDPGDSFTYSFCGGANDASFQIDGSQLRSAASYDFEAKSSYSICIRSTDSDGLFFDKTFTINIANVNESPVITEGASINVGMSVNGNPTPFSLNLNATDPENNALTWSISTPAAHGTASASGTGTSKGIGYTPSANYTGSDSFIVQVSDGTTPPDLITVHVTISAVNSAPTDIGLSNASIAENQAAGSLVGILSTIDIDTGDTFTYSFCGGADDASFQLSGNQLKSAASFDYETKLNYSICIRSIDSGGLDTTKTFVVSVTDVIDTASFADIPMNHWAWQYIEIIYQAGITRGCTNSPLNFCPDALVTRAQMAVFLLKGEHGSAYEPPAVGASTGFNDVATDHWAAAWIKQLAAESITGGCGGGAFCPDSNVTREQMAVFLLKTKYGASYAPPPATGIFDDVPADYWAATWIEQLAAEGITNGCGNGNYCPTSPATRAQMAVFLAKAFNLP